MLFLALSLATNPFAFTVPTPPIEHTQPTKYSGFQIGKSRGVEGVAPKNEFHAFTPNIKPVLNYQALYIETSAQMPVSQLTDITPADWEFQTLQILARRYHLPVSYPDRQLTRSEFAAKLSTVLNLLRQEIETQTIDRQDWTALQRLRAEFTSELASLEQKVQNLENRTTKLEKERFSPTTTLSGKVIFAVSDDLGSQGKDSLVLQQRTQLSLRTSFTDKDRLSITLRSGNVEKFSYVGKLTNEGRLGFDTNTNNEFSISRISYEFPIDDRLSVFIAPEGEDVNASNPLFSDRGKGSISRFGRQNPIYTLIESGGIGLEYKISKELTLNLGYYNQEGEDSKPGGGLFDGDYSASVKLEFRPNKETRLGLLYIHSYNDSNLGTGTGSIRSQLNLDRPVVGNSYGLEASWQIHPSFVLGGWLGFTDATILELGNASVWNYALTFAFPNFGKKGNLLGILIGQEPKLTGTSGFTIGDRTSDRDTSMHLEAFYRYQLKDNLSITPGIIWITAPDHNNNNGDLVIFTVRTTFEF